MRHTNYKRFKTYEQSGGALDEAVTQYVLRDLKPCDGQYLWV